MGTETERLPSVDSLLDPASLRDVLGVSNPVWVEALSTLGYSGSTFHRVTVDGVRPEESSFIVKRTVLAEDWFSHRTDDSVGREAAVVASPELSGIGEIFDLPVIAVAVEPGRTAILMEDVSRWLLPDVREPLDYRDEDLILDSLARLHATFWKDPSVGGITWLHDPEDFFHIMGPHGHGDDDRRGGSARGVDGLVRDGWNNALERLPERVRDALLCPAEDIADSFSHLPRTFVHGDTKIANFAVLPGRRLCALDWAFAGFAPATFDIGWYLAVNASRLCEGKKRTLATYRNFLESHLRRGVDDDLWKELEEAGIVCGTLMLLWAKGSALAAGRPGAEEEWAWWEERLVQWAEKL
jgi:hypothetical protein